MLIELGMYNFVWWSTCQTTCRGQKKLKGNKLVDNSKNLNSVASNVFHNSHLIQKCIQNQRLLLILYTLLNQMRVVKNIRRKDDRMNSIQFKDIFFCFLSTKKQWGSKGGLLSLCLDSVDQGRIIHFFYRIWEKICFFWENNFL